MKYGEAAKAAIGLATVAAVAITAAWQVLSPPRELPPMTTQQMNEARRYQAYLNVIDENLAKRQDELYRAAAAQRSRLSEK
jgi:hypothetical protein